MKCGLMRSECARCYHERLGQQLVDEGGLPAVVAAARCFYARSSRAKSASESSALSATAADQW